MRFQWLQGVLDQSLNAALFGLLMMSYVTPPVLTVILLWKRRIWRPDVAAWRWWVWHVGLALGAVSAVAVPVFVISPIAVLLFGFGGGRQRWVGMVSASISFVALFLSLLAAST